MRSRPIRVLCATSSARSNGPRGASPVPSSDPGVTPRRVGKQIDAPPPEASLREPSVGQQFVDSGA